MATTTNLNSLVINYLTQAQYEAAAQAGTLNENQLYLTPITTSTITNNWTGYTIGNTSANTSTGTYTYDNKLMEFNLSHLTVGAKLSANATGYNVGTISPAPKNTTYCLAHRHDSDMQIGTIEIDTSGIIKLYPFSVISAGVILVAHIIYFHAGLN